MSFTVARSFVPSAALLLPVLTLGSASALESTQVEIRPLGSAYSQGATIPAAVPATLNLPSGGSRLPVVLIVHGSGGVDGRGQFHAEALNAAGIATLEVNMWKPRGVTGPQNRPRHVMDTMPDVWGAWKFLADHPRIDPEKIGMMGFSWGGVASMLAAFDLKPAGMPPELAAARFAAFAPFYPVCTLYMPGGLARALLEKGKPTGAPMLLQTGTRDDYEIHPLACQRMATEFPSLPLTLVMIEGATHAFDGLGNATFTDRSAKIGRGAEVRFIANPPAAAKARADAVAFFRKVFSL